MTKENKRKYVLAGCSGRALGMFAKPMQNDFTEYAELVGIFDPNDVRMKFFNESLPHPTAMYTNFNNMLKEQNPDTLIVATTDRWHHKYIIAGLNAGLDVITEKPMTIDIAKAKAILAAEKKSGKKVSVTFNLRHAPYYAKIKELLRSGVVGKVLSVNLEWYLDTKHGADYFRRWHARKENSGGLLVHKSTHHFDFINWLLEDDPKDVFAYGNRGFYGKNGKIRGKSCRSCRHKKSCEFYWDMLEGGVFGRAGSYYKGMYIDPEKVDNYHRDGCVFSKDIDIEDTMSLNVRYNSGALLNYSLIAYSPYEGWRMSISGVDGRLEAEEYSSGNGADKPFHYIYCYNRSGDKTIHELAKAKGGHGGGDERLLRMLFVDDLPDPLGAMADSRAGYMSVAIGDAGNKSIVSGRQVRIANV